VNINQKDFDPAQHREYGDTVEVKSVEVVTEVVEPAVEPIENPVLALINSAQHAYELEPIPTVGKAAAKVILDNRPAGGYDSLDDLDYLELPSRTSLDEIKSWGVTDGAN